MRHILLVDDEPEVIEGLQLILDQVQNVVIHTAYLASQTLKLIGQFPISLVVADIRMPGMNGIEMWEEIHRRLPDCRVIFLSGVRDFDHIYRIIQNPNARFLTKMEPEEKILAAVQDALAELDQEDAHRLQQQQKALHTYLSSSDADLAQNWQQLRQCPGPMTPSDGIVRAFFLLTHAWAISRNEQLDFLRRLNDELCSQRSDIPSFVFHLHGNVLLWLLPCAAGSELEAAIPDMLRQVCSHLQGSTGVCLHCVYDSGQSSFSQLREEYHQVLEWHQLSDAPTSQVCTLADMQKAIPDEIRAALKKLQFNLQVLQGYLQLGQKDNFRTLLASMFSDSLQQGHPTVALHTYFGALALLYQSLQSTEAADLRERMRREPVFSLPRQTAAQQTLDKLLRYTDETFSFLFPADPYAHPEVASNIQRYIHDHLDRDLSLNALSLRFSLNPNYLSRIFRECTGYKLHEYITQLRLGTAERLLRTSSVRINEIARQVGYDSSHTFIRAFRKQFGVTPAEYRTQQGPAE